MRLQNEPGAESVGFAYNEVDPTRGDRSAVIQVSLPEMASPGDLIAMASELLTIGPVHSLIGGLAFRWDEANEGWAFNRIYALASRYLAIDIQKYGEMAWKTPRGLPGSSWLTFIGPELARRAEIDLEALADREWEHGVMSGSFFGGVMVQAGPQPIQGDLNRLRLPAHGPITDDGLGGHALEHRRVRHVLRRRLSERSSTARSSSPATAARPRS